MKKSGWAAIIGAIAAVIAASMPGILAFAEGAGEKVDTSYEILAEEINVLKQEQADSQEEMGELKDWIRLLVVSELNASPESLEMPPRRPSPRPRPTRPAEPEPPAAMEGAVEEMSLAPVAPSPPPPEAEFEPEMQQMEQKPLPRTLKEAIKVKRK